jgi:hypothetical protein
MSFESDLKKFMTKTKKREERIITGVFSAVRRSITNGSRTTGSPGQPPDLRKSYRTERESRTVAVISSNQHSARSVEDGIAHMHGGYTLSRLKSRTGGFHSVALTRAGFQPLVEEVVAKVVGSDA